MVVSVYTETIIYTNKSDQTFPSTNKIIIKDCDFTQTAYGSIIIKRVRPDNLYIELYPQHISHVVHSE